MLYLLPLLILSLAGCGTKHSAHPSSTPLDSLRGRQQVYMDLAPNQRDADGFIYTNECDSLLFSALEASVPGLGPINIEAAANPDTPGIWYRRPISTGSCYDSDPIGGSDISRDMLIGLITYANAHHRLDIVEGLWQYGSTHLWKMGRDHAVDSRTILTPNLIGLLARVIEHLGGERHPEVVLPELYSTEPGFVSHLTMLCILLEGSVHGSIDSSELKALQTIQSQEPNNALANALLHRYTDGDQSVAVALLQAWPADRLPNTTDWCEEWKQQRDDQSTSLPPCPDRVRTFSGGDFLFVLAVLDSAI